MKLSERVHLVGSGDAGFGLTHECDCHVYLVDGNDSWAVIDAGAGMDSSRIVAQIKACGVDTDRSGHLLVTHGHADHSGGIQDLVEFFPQLEVRAAPIVARWISQGDVNAISLDKGIAQAVYPEDYQFRAVSKVSSIAGGDVVDLGGVLLTAIESPGHCAGHLCWLMRSDSLIALFSGDCVFFNGQISLQNLHDVSIQDYASTLQRLGMEQFVALFPGHGPFSLERGKRHVDAALSAFASGLVPSNFV